MSEPINHVTAGEVTAGEITFYSHWLPTLTAGEYAVSVKPELAGATTVVNEKKVTVAGTFSTDETDVIRETFHVGAPRWALTGSEIYSCYPAPGEVGEFSNTLPHVVFDRCTLPWEITIGSTDPAKPHDPWLALILLTDADFADKRVPSIVTRKLGEFLDATDAIVPKLTPDPYDDKAVDLCQTFDLPASLFSAVMPHQADLPYLAHVRAVNTDNKETWSLLKEGKFSVVVCNRFPETQAVPANGKDWGIVNTVLLVSLEGWGEALNKPEQFSRPEMKDKSCRLLVIGSWRFTCQGSGTFKSLMANLNDNRLLSRPPLGESDGGTLAYLNAALDRGFTPVNHDLRNNDSTISWYRGPLQPVYSEKSMSYADISCADAALRYDSKTGMFDASYAAAWQLGRLLALQDQAFAQALFAFRTGYQRWIRRTNTDALRAMGEKQEKKIQLELGGKFDDIRDSYATTLKGAGYLARNGNPVRGSSPSEPPIPATVQDWLGQAMLLYGVPFQYLVADEAMLPSESIRFFYLNPEWLNALLQGACSVGRTSDTDELADQFLRACFFKVSEKLAFQLRSGAAQAAKARRGDSDTNGTKPTDEPTVGKLIADDVPVLHWPLSGYFLRSAAVESWIGLEVKAKGVDRDGQSLDPLQILRMDRLAPDILLCIYNGKVTEIEVKQPAEAIHFGAASKGSGYQKAGLRKIKGDLAVRGTVLADKKIDPVPTRDARVVKVSELADAIKTQLGDEVEGEFTSAEFALEMIESPARVTFRGPA
jgi:hypothetical protein